MTINIKIDNLIKQLQVCIAEKKVASNPLNILMKFQKETENSKNVVEALLEKFASTVDFWKLNVLSYTLSEYKDTVSKESIQKFLIKSKLNGYKQNRLILVLQEHPDFDFANFVEEYPQKIKLVNYTVRNIVNQLEDNAGNIDDIVKSLQLSDDSFYQHLIDNLCYIYKKKSVYLLAYFAEFPQKEISLAAISALAKQNSTWSGKALRNLVMHSKECEKFLPKDLNRTEKILETHLSWLDSYGNQMLVFCTKKSIDVFIINQENGLQKCMTWNELSSLEQKNILESWQKNTGIQGIEVSVAIEILQNALYKNKQIQCPLPASFGIRNILSAAELMPKEYVIDSDKMNLGHVQNNMYKLTKNSGYLAKEFPFNQWWINTKPCHDYISRYVGNDKNIKYDALQGFVSNFWENNRENLANKFLITADFMHMISESKYKKQIETSLALHLFLKKQKKTMLDIPFVKQLALINIRKVQETKNENENDNENDLKNEND